MKLFVKDREFYKRSAKIAFPVAAQSIITITVNLLDTVMLGSFGETQLSASSLGNQFINIFQVLCLGIGGGTAVLTSRYWGRKDLPSIRKAITLMLRFTVVISLLFSFLTLLFPGWIMTTYADDPGMIEKGVLYLRRMGSIYLFQGLSLTATIVMRSARQVKIPLFASIGSFFVNLSLNWVLIFGHLGAPRMEIEGAAIATLISRIFEFVVIFGYFIFFEKRISYRINHLFQPCRDMLREFFRVGLPVLVSDGLLAFGNNAVAMVMGRIGPEFVAANAITVMVTQISTVFNQGLSNASSIITGNTLGEGNEDRAYQQGITFFVLSAIIGVLAGGIILLISPLVINYYNINDTTKAIAQELMLAISIMVIFQTISSVMTKGVLRGGGDTRFLMIADMLFLWIASVPLGYLAGLVFHWPAFWISVFLKIDLLLKSIWSVHRLLSKKWIKAVK